MNDHIPAILIVDDDRDTCHNLADILEDFGYRVATAHDGPSALELVGRTAFDVALLDFKMPGMDGLEVYREIKRLRPETVALLVSAFAGRETAEEAVELGVWKVLAKPIDPADLLPLVEEATEQPLVLVVDDDPDLCTNLWDLLRERGYRVSIAHDESETLDRMRDASHRVVLIDMKLPSGNGGSVFRQVRQSNPEARVVLVTGFRGEFEDLIRQALFEGADAICYKPFDVPRLLETIRRLAER